MLEISFPHPRNIIPHPCITFFFVLQVIYVFFLNWVKTNEFWSKKYQRMKKLPFDVQFFILKNIQFTVHPCTYPLKEII